MGMGNQRRKYYSKGARIMISDYVDERAGFLRLTSAETELA